MGRNKRCCFAGHREIQDRNVEETVGKMVEQLIAMHGVNEFWVGNYGAFDSLAAMAVRKLKKTYTNIRLNLVLPYLTKDIVEDEEWYWQKFDTILMADIPLSTPKKFHILKTNEFMVDNTAFLICYITRSWGGAIHTFEYAERKGRTIWNVADKVWGQKGVSSN